MVAELMLRWSGGELDLNGWNEGEYGDFKIEVGWNGANWGNPEAVRRQLNTALLDGSATALDGHENREVVLELRIVAADGQALAGGEIPLALADQRRCDLEWTPPDMYAAPMAFEVVAVDLEPLSGRDVEELALIRSYEMRLTCLPWVRSIEARSIEALPGFVAAPTVLDACTSTTGWNVTAPANVTLSVVSGGVNAAVSPGTWDSDFSIDIPMPAMTERYVGIEVETSAIINAYPVLGGNPIPLAGQEGKWWFYDTADISALTNLVLTFSRPGTRTWPSIRILTVGESATPALTVGRQSLRVIPTPGSAKADGSLAIESRNADDDGSGDTLGTVIAYFGTGYDPRLSPHVVTIGSRTPDGSALSGASETGGLFIFDRRASSIPVGSYSVFVRASSASATNINWTLSCGATPPGDDAFINATALTASTVSVGTAYNLLSLGTIDLPGFDIGAASGLDVRFILSCDASVGLDEVLLFNRTTGRLVIADTSTVDRLTESGGVWSVTTDGGATRLWLDAASLEGEERIIAGSSSREMSLPLSLDSEIVAYDGGPVFTPGNTYIYAATTGTIDPAITGEFRPAWHTHAAE